MKVSINCDMGESFGLYKMGDDEAVMPLITEANIACGFHGSDPNHMRSAVELAKKHGVKVGAHFSLPDLAGFGRREMAMEREELTNISIYQVGALKAFLKLAGLELAHLKPHGALYGMAAKQESIAEAIADVGELFQVPIFGLAGTLHEQVYTARGLEFRAEFFTDLEYDDEGNLLITRKHKPVSADAAAARALKAVTEGIVASQSGKNIPVKAQTVCVHSDTPDSVALARAVHNVLKPHL